MKSMVLVLGLLVYLGANDAHAAPRLLSFSGHLSTASGPVHGSVNITFTIFGASTGGTPIWSDTVAVTADLGHVATTLGQAKQIDDTVFTGDNRFLEIKVQEETLPEETLSPRLAIAWVPYAIRSAVTDDLSVQRRTPQGMSCPQGQYIQSIDPMGNIVCAPAVLCYVAEEKKLSDNAVSVTCDAGYIVTGGGCGAEGNVPIQESQPGSRRSWNCQFSSMASIHVRAICCPMP